MELRQLEYFMITCEKGSFNQAAECLYTTQPNVSKVISSLEKELGRPLFERSSRGIRITPYGETVREYAQNILHNVSLIDSLTDRNQGKKFSLATYPSNMISRLLTDFYQEMGDSYIIEHLEGTVEEICNRVAQGLSEIGGCLYRGKTASPVPAYSVPQKAEIHSPGYERSLCLCRPEPSALPR